VTSPELNASGDFVLDCSVATAWLFDDEASPATDALMDRLRHGRAYVPELWYLELGNVLVQAERRGRMTASQIGVRIERLSQLPIIPDHETHIHAFHDIINLARAETLTTYDAAYLELGMRLGLPLASMDKALLRAAKRVGLPTLPE